MGRIYHAVCIRSYFTIVENGVTLPFDIMRVYHYYDVPGGENRGSHAHKELSLTFEKK